MRPAACLPAVSSSSPWRPDSAAGCSGSPIAFTGCCRSLPAAPKATFPPGVGQVPTPSQPLHAAGNQPCKASHSQPSDDDGDPLAPSISLPSESTVNEPSSLAATALYACLAAPSEGERHAQALLSCSRRQLEALRSDAARGQYDGQRYGGQEKDDQQYAEALTRMQRLVGQLEAAAAEQQQRHGHHRLVRMKLALVEREAHWLRDAAPGARRPHRPPLRCATVSSKASPEWLLAPAAGGAYPPTLFSGDIVSVHQLPYAMAWDASWDARVRRLRTVDLLLLHKQWLSWAAMQLPRVRQLRGSAEGDAALRELQDMYARYNCFTLHVARLAPEPWLESAHYSLETLSPLPEPPSNSHVLERWKFIAPEATQQMLQVIGHYKQVIGGLRQEQVQLQQRYAQIAGSARGRACGRSLAHDCGGTGGCEGAHTVDPVAASFEADEVLRRTSSNLRQQQLQLSHALHAGMYAAPMEETIRVRLVLYPLADNGQVLAALACGCD